ncbi:DUF2975 domain-containing protein [Fulvivirga sedimenti]|uniref:DUF2975 domain-containing protein n=1 Tax=Fulvivirga sedimenti TaxID=2879465 RepID=A0A9X1HQ97_9BACT|nr:DUF2975 domain-containing protein [Fulvivirga sedimenti]MCA6075167.1 DUF2975 domain-containing protein [Fulvivirga sedimenti]MCA6076344.1 DUF2975 domain-containing protein [Fulvivirga sedimenti]MCA6077472.1 DUF2975 domain-containing protein [Fulvivirga sedimenti]
MKRISRISTVSLWVVNIAIIVISAGSLFSYYMLSGFVGEGVRPESDEGMVGWSDTSEIKVGQYYLAKVSEFKDGVYRDYLELRVPHPRIYLMNTDTTGQNLKIVPRTDVTVRASYEDRFYLPVVYEFFGEKDIKKIIWLFIGYLTVSLALSLFVLITFRRFLLSLSRGEFFIRSNYKRLLLLSLVSFLIPVFKYVGDLFSSNYFEKNFRVVNGGVYLYGGLDLTPMIFGVVLLLMAGMVYEGSRLREESDLTI